MALMLELSSPLIKNFNYQLLLKRIALATILPVAVVVLGGDRLLIPHPILDPNSLLLLINSSCILSIKAMVG
jgi:hypothetical protein